MMQAVRQISFEDLFAREEKGKHEEKGKYDEFDLRVGDFEYLKYLKANEMPKLIKLNYVKADGIRNLQKVDRFIKALQAQGEKPYFNLEDHKDTFRVIFNYSSGVNNEFDKMWEEAIVKDMIEVTNSSKISGLGIDKEDDVICIKLSGKTFHDRIHRLVIMINLDNTFKKKYSVGHFKWRMSDHFYNCGVMSFNVSTFGLFSGAIDLFSQTADLDLDSDMKSAKESLSKFILSFKNSKRYYRFDSILEAYLDKVVIDYEKYVNYVDNKRIASDDNRLYARAFQTKKNIKEETLRAMKNNNFLKDFSFVELDDTTDLDKFFELSEYFLEYRKKMPHLLPTIEDNVKFRVRRLGNYRALGLYFPAFDTIAVDVNGVESFVHECGHWLDYKKLDSVSLKDEFISLISIPFKEDFIERAKEDKTYPKSSYYYWCSSREIFARAFEVYIKNKYFKNMSCPFLKTDERYETDIVYAWLVENIEIINEFFDNLNYEL